jgi:phosphoribosylaminoimidazole-succinocarboxamide synthase
MEVLYDGKTKRLVKIDDKLLLQFKDTVLGNAEGKPDPGGNFVIGRIKGKAASSASVAIRFFEFLRRVGIETHFLRKYSATELEILPAESIPLEVIYRARAYGSFLRRYRGAVEPLAELDIVEFTLKNDALGDPLVESSALPNLGIASPEEVEEMRRKTRTIGKLLHGFLREFGLGLVDVKIEFGRRKGKLVVIDAINGDTMRVMDGTSGKVLDWAELGKKLSRRNLGNIQP